MSTEFKVDGLDTLLRKLENMGKEGSIIEGQSLVEAGQPMLEDMKNTSAFKDRTGKLRKSLKISQPKKAKYGSGRVIWIGDVDRKANYSWYLEYGDSKRKPRPFMMQAYSRNQSSVYQKLKQAIEKNLQNK
jgi:HK97 gp10 family phage protein